MEMDMVRPGYPAGDLRVSDAERDRAVAELSEHFQAGRLTLEEFKERSGRALSARTGRELRGLLADLPGRPAPPLDGQATARRLGQAFRVAVAAPVVICVAIAEINGGQHGIHPLARAIVAIAILCVIAARVHSSRSRTVAARRS